MSELLVRTYNVGCGDCIFVRIPDTDRPRHVLIDCGNFFGDRSSELRQAVGDVEALLKEEGVVPVENHGQLDLLVATHQHWDHIKGFEAALDAFKRINVQRIWLSVGMKEDHPQGQQLRSLWEKVDTAIERFAADPDLAMNPGLHSLLMMMSMSKAEATKALVDYIPSHHGIETSYVYRGFEDDLPEEEGAQLIDFKDPGTRLVVLAPEKEIDESYMGAALGLIRDLGEGAGFISELIPESQRIPAPTNISLRQFRFLKTRLRYTSLLAASASNHVVNNTSVVLLLEWRGRRLLFTGDAEKGSWEMMRDKACPELSSAVDFLKVSHHGSHNGTPYDLDDPCSLINKILDDILPKDNSDNAHAVVPTLAGRIHAVTNPVPLPELMNELAERVRNTQEYAPEPGMQPQRTDKVEDGDWIDIKIGPMLGDNSPPGMGVGATPQEEGKEVRKVPEKSPWHSAKGRVYHNNTECNTGNNIETENKRSGTGGKRLCHECNRLNRMGR